MGCHVAPRWPTLVLLICLAWPLAAQHASLSYAQILDTCKQDHWCQQWSRSYGIKEWLPRAYRLFQEHQSSTLDTADNGTLVDVQRQKTDWLLHLHNHVIRPYGVFGLCPGIGQRLVQVSPSQPPQCTCNHPHGCPLIEDAFVGHVVRIGDDANSEAAVGTAIVTLGFVVVLCTLAAIIYTSWTTPMVVYVVE
jgi:hypothetical protein